MAALVRMGMDALPEMVRYLDMHAHENILLLSDLKRPDSLAPSSRDPLTLVGYRLDRAVIAVQGFYRQGRWFPHFDDPVAINMMLEDMLRRRVRWIMGVRRVVDPLLARLRIKGFGISYDEQDHLCYVDRAHYHPFVLEGVRQATTRDVPDLANLRRSFENEYFLVPLRLIDMAWCYDVARRYVAEGAFLGERDGRAVSMVAVEATIPALTHIGAVYTLPGYRGQGLARAVVAAICGVELARVSRVTLTVRTDNEPALRVYEAIGFHLWDAYRMARLGRA